MQGVNKSGGQNIRRG